MENQRKGILNEKASRIKDKQKRKETNQKEVVKKELKRRCYQVAKKMMQKSK